MSVVPPIQMRETLLQQKRIRLSFEEDDADKPSPMNQDENEAPIDHDKLFTSDRDASILPEQTAQTPFDFIEHLKKAPGSSDFAYMVPVHKEVKFGQSSYNPYKLNIVPFEQINKAKGFYTISREVRAIAKV